MPALASSELPAASQPSCSLYSIAECPELMADGCIGDLSNHLVFLSIWGRETAIQAFLARLTLGHDEQGLRDLHIVTEPGVEVPLYIGDTERLEKRLTRAYRRTLFGALTHLWLFDRRCVRPDKVNSSALALLPREDNHRLDRLWALVRDTCPLPLLDHWRDAVLNILQSQEMLRRLPLSLGSLEGHHLAIDVASLTATLGDLIRRGSLTTTDQPKRSRTPLQRVA